MNAASVVIDSHRNRAGRTLPFLVFALAAAVLLRLVWLDQVLGTPLHLYGAGEAFNVARAFARTGTIADAYFEAQGPTAHLMPLHPIIAGTIMRIAGFGTEAALALLGWAFIQMAAAYLAFFALYRHALPPQYARWAFAFLCLVPVYVYHEVVDFRFWEGASAAALSGANLLLLLRGAERQLSDRERTTAAALLVLACFVSPPVGAALVSCWAMHAIRVFTVRERLHFLGAASLFALLAFGPWTVRNMVQLDEPIVTRSNLGLELALANHEALDHDLDTAEIFHSRFVLHPFGKEHFRPIIATEGEAGYFRRLEDQAINWIVDNPAVFARHYARRLSEFLFPRPWQIRFTGWGEFGTARTTIACTVAAMGLAGLLLGMVTARRGGLYVTIYVAALAAQFAVFQPTLRYSYLIWPILVFEATYLLWHCRLWITHRATVPDRRDRRAVALRDGRAPPCRG